jgi:hypothetical protein
MAVIATTLTALTELHIRGTMVTERGKQLVQLRLPGIDIVGDKK